MTELVSRYERYPRESAASCKEKATEAPYDDDAGLYGSESVARTQDIRGRFLEIEGRWSLRFLRGRPHDFRSAVLYLPDPVSPHREENQGRTMTAKQSAIKITGANAGQRLEFAGKSRVFLSHRPGVAQFHR